MRDLRPWDRVLALGAPLLLCAIAILGIARVHTLDQSTWSGASFGMFATFENETSRFLRVNVETPHGTETVDLHSAEMPRSVQRAVKRARVVPTATELRKVADELLEHRTGTEARLELWKLDFHKDGPRLEARRAVVVQVTR